MYKYKNQTKAYIKISCINFLLFILRPIFCKSYPKMKKYKANKFVSFQLVIKVCSIKMKAFADSNSFPSAQVPICNRILY